MLTMTAPVIIRRVCSMSVHITAENPPNMVKIPQAHNSTRIET